MIFFSILFFSFNIFDSSPKADIWPSFLPPWLRFNFLLAFLHCSDSMPYANIFFFTYARTCMPTHTHAHTQTYPHTHTHTQSPSFFPLLMEQEEFRIQTEWLTRLTPHSLSKNVLISLSLSLSHTHTLTHTHTNPHSQAHSLTHVLEHKQAHANSDTNQHGQFFNSYRFFLRTTSFLVERYSKSGPFNSCQIKSVVVSTFFI